MFKVNVDSLIFSSVGNKHTEGYDTRVYKIIEAEFNSLKNFWSKAFFIYLLSRFSEGEDFHKIYNKLRLEIQLRDELVFIQYIHPYLVELKKRFIINDYYDYIIAELVNSSALFGRNEVITLIRLMSLALPAESTLQVINSKNLNLSKSELDEIYKLY